MHWNRGDWLFFAFCAAAVLFALVFIH